MNVFEIEAPAFEAARQIARNLYARSVRSMAGATGSTPSRRTTCWISCRTGAARHAAGADDRLRQRAAGRAGQVAVDDLPKASSAKGKLGFLQ
jgi:ATP-dependent Lon protease